MISDRRKFKNMKKKNALMYFTVSAVCLLLFVALTVCLFFVDRRAASPTGSVVGFASVNSAIFDLAGVNYTLYDLTEILGYLSLAVAAGLAVLGFVQLIKRRSLKRVDTDLLCMAVLFLTVVAVYVAFELINVNLRPVLMPGEEVLEPSYPSTHTVISVCVLIPAASYFMKRLRTPAIRIPAVVLCLASASVTVVCRLLSGAHWFTDILGGLLISGALVSAYFGAVSIFSKD